ncbi:hypothetical protein GO755_22660 [Spirosoma sp. HMF4905]|uniref:Uncharacterized protein n=1 Tax=Spirosoma arboris TaxID=2682092 RepID=A0A7K1SGB3_9BACT|nr:hypothetical protein [Spirosoma arboris]MVM32859.1 hypothetical protein [Spirosoma arboris]
MQPKFSVLTGNRKPVNQLEAHLLKTAQTWCSQESIGYKNSVGLVQVRTLLQFCEALQRERTLYCLDHQRSRENSVRITHFPNSRSVTGRQFISVCVAGKSSETFVVFYSRKTAC